MFDVGGGELILIILAAIVLFGPKKMPEIAQMFNKGMRQVRKAQSQFQSQMNEIQSEINKNINIDELNSVKATANEFIDHSNDTLKKAVREIEKPE